MNRRPPRSTLFPYPTLFRSARRIDQAYDEALPRVAFLPFANETDLPQLSKEFSDRAYAEIARRISGNGFRFTELTDRKSTRLNSSHQIISYAAFSLTNTTNT